MKKFLTLLIAALFLFTAAGSGISGAGFHVSAADDQGDSSGAAEAAKKIVSVVYDDSGSMYTSTNWASANYAMQAFAALLSSQDEMYITYMSDLNAGAQEVDLSRPQEAVDRIRTNLSASGTPLESVEIAMDRLESIRSDDPDTQYWLVILTDGQMEPSDRYQDINQCLSALKGTEMPNGSEVYITYMGIGSGATEVSADEANQLSSVMVGNSSEITAALSGIANEVSGRLPFDSADLSQTGGSVVSVHTDLPLYSIAVFSQGSDATVTKADPSLDVGDNISLRYPDAYNGAATDTSLFGNAVTITNGSDLTGPGDYTITFSKNIDLNTTVIMYQPAIEMQANIYRNGVLVKDPDKLRAGEQVDVEIVPVNPETGDVISDSDLPDGMKWSVDYAVNGDNRKHSDTNTMNDIELEEGRNGIDCEMTVPGFTPQKKTFSFQIRADLELGVTAVQPEGKDGARYYRSQMGRKNCLGEPLKFYITGTDKDTGKTEKLTKSRMKSLGYDQGLKVGEIRVDEFRSKSENPVARFVENLGFRNAEPVIAKQADDGSFELYPKANRLSYIFITGGTYHVTVELDDGSGETAEGCFTVIPRLIDILLLLLWLVIALAVLYILLIATKKKFSEHTLHIEMYSDNGNDEGEHRKGKDDIESLNRFSGDWWNPFRRHSRMEAMGFTFYADDMGGLLIRGSSLKNYAGFKVTQSKPENSFSGLKSQLEANKKRQMPDPQDVSIGGIPFCVIVGKRIYKIYTA